MNKVFIDGKAGTTGLRIYDRLASRSDIELITLSDSERKDENARRSALNSCDIAFLCLPDAAAIQAVNMITNESVRVIDTSTAHRTSEGWCYGFPELFADGFDRIKNAKRIAVPGCHAGGFIALVLPLIKNGILKKDSFLTCFSLTGYSGGGNAMIAEYEAEGRSHLLDAPRVYALPQQHKHLKEMTAISGLNNPPVFCPVVGDFYSGMLVTVSVFSSQLEAGKSVEDIKSVYRKMYNSPIISYCEGTDESGFLSACALSGKDSMQISVYGCEERITLAARFDNLGKGASGAAVECLNILLGCDEKHSLNL